MNPIEGLRSKQRNGLFPVHFWRALSLGSLMLVTALAGCSTSSTQASNNATSSSPVASGAASPAAGASPTEASGQASGLLARVQSRGKLICGTSGKNPGFSFVNPQGEYTGFDVDICRAIAAAIFNDPQKVEFRNISIAQRFTNVQTGAVDVLSETATVTIDRQASIGIDFAPVVLYDGQSIMVKKSSGIKSLENLAGKSICVQTGTTNEQNLADQMRKRGIQYKQIVFDDNNATFAAFQQGRCQAVTSDRSGLVSNRTKLPNPDDNQILDTVFSKEPLAPGVKQGDPQWSNVVRWVVYALIQADEFEVNSKNIDQLVQTSKDPDVRRFLGVEGEIGKGLGLSNDFARKVVKLVGNYSEIYDRNFGPNTPFKLERGPNQLWTKGGLLYSPPFR